MRSVDDFMHQPQDDKKFVITDEMPIYPKTDFSQMPINDVANYNTPEALDYFWAHKKAYDYFTPQRLEHYKVVAKYARQATGNLSHKVIDFGCGCGQMAYALSDSFRLPFAKYVGMDYATSAVAIAQKENPEATFIRGDILDNGLPSESYDLALCIEVLEHIIDYPKALVEMFRVLKPGGAFVLTVPNAVLDRGAPYHVNFWTQGEIVLLLSGYGEIVHHEMIMDDNSTLVHVRKAAK